MFIFILFSSYSSLEFSVFGLYFYVALLHEVWLRLSIEQALCLRFAQTFSFMFLVFGNITSKLQNSKLHNLKT